MRYIALFLVLGSALAADASSYYKLERVKRLDTNLYSAVSGTAKIIIETRLCVELASGFDDALLKYDRYSYDNKIIFDNDRPCDVVKVIAQ